MSDEALIKETFSFTDREQAAFPYIRRYMQRIGEELDGILSDEKKARRFMLVGLFLTYRACNHMGVPLATNREVAECVAWFGKAAIQVCD